MSVKFYQTDNETTTDVWITPKYILDALGGFDLDPASNPFIPWPTAIRFYSLENGEDGLSLPWEGRVWCNPPYSNWARFLEKMKMHGNGIALIFARTETAGFFDHVWDSATSILFLKRRVQFLRLPGLTRGSSTAPSVLISYGDNNADSIRAALSNGSLEGKHIILQDPTTSPCPPATEESE